MNPGLDYKAIKAARCGMPVPFRVEQPSEAQRGAEYKASLEFRRALDAMSDEQWEQSRTREKEVRS